MRAGHFYNVECKMQTKESDEIVINIGCNLYF